MWDYSRTLRLTGNYAYQKSIDDATGQDAGYAPHHHIYLRTDWRYPSGWLAGAQINRVRDRMRAPGDARSQIPDYTTVDLTVRTPRIKDQWELAASVRNLFDTNPPFAISYDSNNGSGSSWEPRVADPRGRSFTMQAEVKF